MLLIAAWLLLHLTISFQYILAGHIIVISLVKLILIIKLILPLHNTQIRNIFSEKICRKLCSYLKGCFESHSPTFFGGKAPFCTGDAVVAADWFSFLDHLEISRLTRLHTLGVRQGLKVNRIGIQKHRQNWSAMKWIIELEWDQQNRYAQNGLEMERCVSPPGHVVVTTPGKVQ